MGAFPGPKSSNGAIPQQGNVTFHTELLRAHLSTLIPDPKFFGLCLIDFETVKQ